MAVSNVLLRERCRNKCHNQVLPSPERCGNGCLLHIWWGLFWALALLAVRRRKRKAKDFGRDPAEQQPPGKRPAVGTSVFGNPESVSQPNGLSAPVNSVADARRRLQLEMDRHERRATVVSFVPLSQRAWQTRWERFSRNWLRTRESTTARTDTGTCRYRLEVAGDTTPQISNDNGLADQSWGFSRGYHSATTSVDGEAPVANGTSTVTDIDGGGVSSADMAEREELDIAVRLKATTLG